VTVRQLRPAAWRDDLLAVPAQPASGGWEQAAVPMLGRPDNPHRSLYRTLSFGLRRFQPEIIHAEEEPDSLAALQIAWARRLFAPHAKLILNTWQNVDRRRRPEVRWVTRQSLRAADAVLCANQEAQRILQRQGYTGYTRVLPAVGVDTQVFKPCSNPIKPGAFTVGYVGRLVPEKGIETLLAALARLGDAFQVRLIGAGPAQPALEAQAAALEVLNRVEFLPARPPAQVAAEYCRLQALVLPSRTTPVWKEQFGRVLAEAMACGVPVVGSDSGAIPEVIGEAGLIFPEGDAAALAQCLRRLQAEPALRRALVARGLARAQSEFAQSVIAARTLAVYRQLLGQQPL
jgi:glycosyltransferase involved in cell wall biosynthesis